MSLLAARSVIVLGVLHVVYGVVQFRAPLRDALAEGFVGRFMVSDARRLAFWFILVGPLLALTGQAASWAVQLGDTGMVRTIGVYLLAAAAVGGLAFPRSPMWALVPPAVIFLSS